MILFYIAVMHLKDADGIANIVEPDQTAPGSTLFAQTYLVSSLRFLWYIRICVRK